MINKKDLAAFARDSAETIKSEKDLTDFRPILAKVTVEVSHNAELDDHLGYDKHEQSSSRIAWSDQQDAAHGRGPTWPLHPS
jgi:transposase-like protein